MKQGWEIKKVGECFESIKNGATIKQERGATGIPITRIETLSGGVFNRDRLGYANIQSAEKYASYILDDGDMLLSHINSKTYIGRTVVYNKMDNEEIIHGMNLLRLKTIRTILSPYYAFYCFKSDSFRNQIASYRKDAVNQSSIPVSDLKKINIPIPPLSEQSKIVSELDCLSGIIEKKKQQLKELDALAQSIFYEMFGDPVENERGWEVKKLGEVCDGIGDGLHGTPDYDANGTVAFINGTNLIDGRISITEKTLFVNEGEAKKHKIEMNEHTILLSINGTLGKTAIYRNENVILGKSACYCIVNKDYLNISFVEKMMATKAFKDFLEDNSSKSTIKNVGLKVIRNYKTILPPLALQNEFVSKIENIEQQKALIKQSIAEVETLFNARMQEYFE